MRYHEIDRQGQYSLQDDLFFLKKYSHFSLNSINSFKLTYQSNNAPDLVKLREKYCLDEIAGEGDDLQKIVNIRRWIYKIFERDRNAETFNTLSFCNDFHAWNADIVLEKGKHKDYKADCAAFATVMTEVLLALGYKARWIQCLPMDLRHEESHCITHVYIPYLQKWIIVDSAQDLLYFNKYGIPMSLWELRNAIINNDKIRVFSKKVGAEEIKLLFRYWAKNIFRFRTIESSEFGFLTKYPQTNIYLNPEGYCIEDKDVIELFGIKHLHTTCADEFFKTPENEKEIE